VGGLDIGVDGLIVIGRGAEGAEGGLFGTGARGGC